MHKSAAEIALMQIAADITIAAYRHTAPRIEAGMTPADIGMIMRAATTALGGRSEFEMALLGEASAYHGGNAAQKGGQGPLANRRAKILLPQRRNSFQFETAVAERGNERPR